MTTCARLEIPELSTVAGAAIQRDEVDPGDVGATQ
jgi:hypothetical protein